MLEEYEIDLLLTDLIEVYGYDFSGYTRPVLNRRINRIFNTSKLCNFATFRLHLRHNPLVLRSFINDFTVPVTEMFRDATFFSFLRCQILPQLKNYPLIRIWVAGCSTGQEAYSVALILHELNLLNKSILYATDINPFVLDIAAAGKFPIRNLTYYAENYHLSGGQWQFSNYYIPNGDHFKLHDFLKEKIVFSSHNLVSDASFNQFQLIICRNVMIYFNTELQSKVCGLFDASLNTGGFLALGTKETLRFCLAEKDYKRVDCGQKIWQKIK